MLILNVANSSVFIHSVATGYQHTATYA